MVINYVAFSINTHLFYYATNRAPHPKRGPHNTQPPPTDTPHPNRFQITPTNSQRSIRLMGNCDYKN